MTNNKTKRFKWQKIALLTLIVSVVLSLFTLTTSAYESDNSYIGTWYFDEPLTDFEFQIISYYNPDFNRMFKFFAIDPYAEQIYNDLGYDEARKYVFHYVGMYSTNTGAEGLDGKAYYIRYLKADGSNLIAYRNSYGDWEHELYRTIRFTHEPPNAIKDMLDAHATKLSDDPYYQFEYLKPEEPEQKKFLGRVLDVFMNVGRWIGNAVSTLVNMFFVDGRLTFLGTLAVGGLALSVSLLLINIISNFLAFRG